MRPFFSICIPAYKRVRFLKRLLDSISLQTFKDFEVIVTDDSDDSSVGDLVSAYDGGFLIRYKKNENQLGTPENWNESIRYATGTWIKLMHDDDWFADKNSLSVFCDSAKQNPQSSFIYSAYFDVPETANGKTPVYASAFRRRKLAKNPVTLISSNIIGPPSVTLVKNDGKVWYDRNVKWVVDIDFYIRCLEKNRFFYIPKALINVGVHPQQVTKFSFRVLSVEIPENFYLLEKTGISNLQEILIYDAWWRTIRNLQINSVKKIRENGYHGPVHSVICSMMRWQSGIPRRLLRVGLFSKMFMIIHYLTHRKVLGS